MNNQLQNDKILEKVLLEEKGKETTRKVWDVNDPDTFQMIDESIRNSASNCYRKGSFFYRHEEFDDICQKLWTVFLEYNKRAAFPSLASIRNFLKCKASDIYRGMKLENSYDVSSIEEKTESEEAGPEFEREVSIAHNHCEKGEDNVVIYDMISKLSDAQKAVAIIKGYLLGIDCLEGLYKKLYEINPEGMIKIEQAIEERANHIKDGVKVRKEISNDIIFKNFFGYAGVYSSAAVKIRNELKEIFSDYQKEAGQEAVVY